MSEETFSGTYRVIGFGGDGTRLLLYDTEREDSVWVANADHPDHNYNTALYDTLSVVSPGNILQATLTGDLDNDEVWWFNDANIARDTTLAFVDGTDYVPGPADDTWQSRAPDEEVGVNVLQHNETGEPLFELQTHPEEFDGRNIFEDMRIGRFPLEAWYESLTSTPAGAHDIIVVNPNGREYVAILAFPQGDKNDEILDEVRRELA